MIETIRQSKIQLSDLTLSSYPEILTDDALVFLSELHQMFDKRRKDLLAYREAQQALFDTGVTPNFPSETQSIRESDWKAASIPEDLLDRRVEITGPVDRKMVINALNSGANTFMADFEDSTAPTWTNVMEGQENLRDANRREIELFDPIKQKEYTLNENTAVLLVRPRGLHLDEKHLLFGDQALSGSLVDFGLYVFHNTQTLLRQGTAPYFYLPKLENYEEARWWNDVFVFAQEYLEVPVGTFKCTLLVETITASFQLNEFIYELKDHIVGLNCGRWDYIFSYIKKLKNHAGFVVPNRDQVTMTTPFMAAYSKLVISVCHKRGIHAMGGMAAQIPIRNNATANEIAINKVKVDKEREVLNGHDGTWVAHPGLVAVAKDVFDKHMPTPNQIDKQLDLEMSAEALLEMPTGTITEEGIRKNINVAILYIESWLRGKGAAALYHLMEDAATAEISRTQLWHWLDKQVQLEDGRVFTLKLYQDLLDDEVEKIILVCGPEVIRKGKYKEAVTLLNNLILNEEFDEFLTLPAYDYL
jgi:malate synthase